MKLVHWGICCALALTLAGCGGGKPGDKPVTQVALPATPEGTAEASQKALSEGKFEVVWQMLPAKHQGDVKAVLTLAGEKLDPDVYNGAMNTVSKLLSVIKAKQDFIVNNQMVKDSAKNDTAAAKEKLTAGINLLEVIVNSDLKTVDGLKKMDVQQFLANVGAAANEASKKLTEPGMDNPLEKIRKAKITVDKTEGDKATLKYDEAKVEWEKIDGKWVPHELAKDWDKHVASAKEGLNNMKLSPEDKKQALDVIKQIDEELTKFADAKTQAEFDAAVQGAMAKLGPIGMMFGGGGGGGGGFGPGGGAGPTDFGAPPPGFGDLPEVEESLDKSEKRAGDNDDENK